MANFWDADPVVGGQAAPAAPQAAGPNFWDSDPVVDQGGPIAGVTKGAVAPLRIQMGNPLPDQSQAPVSSFADFLRSIPGGIVGGLSNAASTLGQAAQGEMGQPVDVPDTSALSQLLQQNVTGPLPTPQGPAGKFGQTIGQFVGNPGTYVAPGSLPAKLGMAVLGGIGSEGAGQLAEGTPYEGPARLGGAVLGSGAAAKAFQPFAVSSALGAKPPSSPTIPALKAAASAGYEAPEVAAVELSAPAVANKINALSGTLAQDIDPILAPKTFAILDKATTAPPDSFVTVSNLRSLYRMLGKVALSNDPTEREAAQRAQGQIHGIMETMQPSDVMAGNPVEASNTIKTANANYSAAKTAERLDKRIAKAEMSAEASHSGMNVGNRIRQQAVQILNNDALRRGLKPGEIAKIEEIVHGTAARNTLRWFSNLFGGGGGLGAVVTGAVAEHAVGPLGWLLSPIGIALKSVEGALTARAAGKISEMIRNRAPLGQAVQNAAQEWLNAREAMTSGPSSAKFAAFSLASRNLSNNLKSIGVEIKPVQLMVQGPVNSRAENEKKKPIRELNQ